MSSTSNNDPNSTSNAPIDQVVYRVLCSYCGRTTNAREANQAITRLTGHINDLIRHRDRLQRVIDKREIENRRRLARDKSKADWKNRKKDA